MRDDDDNVLAGYDLAAWEAPAPAPGLADAVVARAKQPAPVAAIDPAERPPRRRWWIAGAIGAVLVAGTAFALFGIQRAPKDGSDTVVATTARALDLGPSSAQLDAGAVVIWRRAAHRVTITQPFGAATWHVAGDDTFVIDAGAVGASVEATGASLRVEAKLFQHTMATSALTAAAVAMVVVTVYEGRVKVTHGGETTMLQPGATLEIPNRVEPPPVAVGPTQAEDELRKEIAELRKQLAERTVPNDSCDEVSCVLNNYDGACCLKLKKDTDKKPAPPKCDAAAESRAGDDQLQRGAYTAALDAFEKSLACRSDPMVIRKAALAACNARNKPRAVYWLGKVDPGMRTPLVQVCVRNGVQVDDPKPACDAVALRQQGEDDLQNGKDAAAMAAFEASFACRPDSAVQRFAFMAACRSGNADAARRYYESLPATTTTGVVQICLRNGIDLSQAVRTKDGTLRLASMPSAKILIDGKDTGKTTPATLQVTPGKHKVTYVIDDNRYTWAVEIEAGKTSSVMKDLR